MIKQILKIIEGCESCPNKDHKGAFGAIAYVPNCTISSRRVIPYNVSANERGRAYASPKPGVPSWCPLDDYVPT